MTRRPRIRADVWACAIILPLLLLIAFRREPDLSDESYYVYEAWSAWDVAGFHRPGSPLGKQFGHLLGIPALWRDVPSLLDLRLFGLGLWLLGYASLAWALAQRWKLPHAGAWTLLLLPHSHFLATPGYHSLPSILTALSFAAALRVRDGTGPPWAFLSGGLLGAVPFAHPPHLPLLLPVALIFVWRMERKARLAYLVGFALMLSAFLALWWTDIRFLQAEQRHALRGLARSAEAVAWTQDSPGNRFLSLASAVIGLRWPKIVGLLVWVFGILGLGFLLRRPLVRAWDGSWLSTRTQQGLIVLAGLVFCVLWTLQIRRNATLAGLLTWALVLILPALFLRLKQEKLPLRELAALSTLALVFGLAQATVGMIRTESFYFMHYSPLVWIPAGLLWERLSTAPASRAAARTLLATLLSLNLWVALGHNHRGASILQGRRVAFDHPAYRGLGMTPARRDFLVAVAADLAAQAPEATVYGLDQSPFVYLLAGREAPFRQVFLIEAAPAWSRRMHRESPQGAWVLFQHDGREIGTRLRLPPETDPRVLDFGYPAYDARRTWKAARWQAPLSGSETTGREPPALR